MGEPYAKQTWAKGLDAKGRPVVLPNTEPTVEGNLVWPSLQGATNWHSPSYSPLTKMFYVAAREMGAYYYKGEAAYKPGHFSRAAASARWTATRRMARFARWM